MPFVVDVQCSLRCRAHTRSALAVGHAEATATPRVQHKCVLEMKIV